MDATLGERELDVMGVLWQKGPGTVAEVRERLPVALAYNTVLTILRNLEVKQFVGHTEQGRFFRYFPVVSEQSVRGSVLTRLVDKLFRGSAVGLVTHLVEHEQMSAEEMRNLHQLIDERLPPRPRSKSKVNATATPSFKPTSQRKSPDAEPDATAPITKRSRRRP